MTGGCTKNRACRACIYFHVCVSVCVCVCVCVSLSVDDQAGDGLGSDDICCSDVLPVKTTHVTGLSNCNEITDVTNVLYYCNEITSPGLFRSGFL